MAANECNMVPEWSPNRWTFTHFNKCTSIGTERPTISIWEVYQAVIFEAFLWGLGTAIGELPPYFVSRAASLDGKK